MNDTTSKCISNITTLIFDVDDTLYDVGNGFTAHRHVDGVISYMMDTFNFSNEKEAIDIRNTYFQRYHSTVKGLTAAEQEGKLPSRKRPMTMTGDTTRTTRTTSSNHHLFDPQELSEWWATKLHFHLLKGPYKDVATMLESCPLNVIAFSNGPRTYVLRVLKELGLNKAFPDEQVFAVDDVMPACKPEKEAFEVVMKSVGVTDPSQCIMVEDSMKNIRAAKDLGMFTVLIAGKGRLNNDNDNTFASKNSLADAAEATKPGDAPNSNDPSVDVAIETVIELKSVLPGLWKKDD